MFRSETGGRREERTGRTRAARSLEECERGGERGQLRKASSCAPSTLILSGLFAWGTHSPTTPSLAPPISCSYPLCPRYTSNEQKKPFDALDFTCFVHKHTNCSVEMHVNLHRQTHAGVQTYGEQRSRTGKINISVLTLHLPMSVFPTEEEAETDRADVRTESLKVQM